MDPRLKGARDGRKAAGLEWSRFLKSGDAEGLSLAPDTRLLAAREAARLAVESEDPVEMQAYAAGYARALEDALKKKTQALLPAAVRRKIHHYCFLAHWLAAENDQDPGSGDGYGVPVSEYDFRLGLAPVRKALRPAGVKPAATRAGRQAALRDWKGFLENPEPTPGRIAWTSHQRDLLGLDALERGFDLPPGLPGGDPARRRLGAPFFALAFGAAYREEIGRRIRRFMPSGARGQTNLVCALARRLGLHFPRFGWAPGAPG